MGRSTYGEVEVKYGETVGIEGQQAPGFAQAAVLRLPLAAAGAGLCVALCN